jgi:hypothetical protein
MFTNSPASLFQQQASPTVSDTTFPGFPLVPSLPLTPKIQETAVRSRHRIECVRNKPSRGGLR